MKSKKEKKKKKRRQNKIKQATSRPSREQSAYLPVPLFNAKHVNFVEVNRYCAGNHYRTMSNRYALIQKK